VSVGWRHEPWAFLVQCFNSVLNEIDEHDLARADEWYAKAAALVLTGGPLANDDLVAEAAKLIDQMRRRIDFARASEPV
jgi:hypothetical protein